MATIVLMTLIQSEDGLMDMGSDVSRGMECKTSKADFSTAASYIHQIPIVVNIHLEIVMTAAWFHMALTGLRVQLQICHH